MTVLDRVIFRMMQAPGYIPLPISTPSILAVTRDAWILDSSTLLAHFRWGFVAVLVRDWYEAIRN